LPHAVFITSYPFPDSAATANRVQALAEGVARLSDWTVTIVGSGPRRELADESSFPSFSFQVIQCPPPTFNRSNLIIRAWGEIRHTFRLLAAAKRQDGDVLIATVPSVFLMVTVLWPGRKRTIIDLRDVVWEYLAASGGIRHWAGRFLRALSRSFLNRASVITVTNNHEAESLRTLMPRETVLIRNGISRGRFEQLASIAPSDAPGDPFHIVYIGNIGIAQELDTLLDAVGGKPDYTVTLVGGGADYERIQCRIQEKEWENIHLTGALPWQKTIGYLEDADCLFGQIGAVYTTAVPSKLFEYASCARPTVFGAPHGPAREIMNSFRGFHPLEPACSRALYNKLEEIRSGHGLTHADAEHNRNQVKQHFLREAEAEKLADLVARIDRQNVQGKKSEEQA